jgi:putative spermidine/putrescine transport system substrate-binding protein
VAWDVVEVESADLGPGCEAGLFERIDRSAIAHASLMLPAAVQECGVGAFVWSTVLAYNPAKLKEAPRNWADFWDVNRFPGKRGLRKGARYNLEFALMADGVNRADVYRLLATEQGVARAMRKLEELKPYIVWWESGAQPPRLLASGEVVMSSAFNGRVAAANRDSARLEVVWADAIFELDYWVIVKGSPRRDEALRYINHATSDHAQLAFSREIPYGPTNFNAILKYDSGRGQALNGGHQALIDLSMAPSDLPSAPGNLRRSLGFDAGFWARHGAQIDQRFALAFR